MRRIVNEELIIGGSSETAIVLYIEDRPGET